MLLRVGLESAWVDMAREASRVLCAKALPRRTIERSMLKGLRLKELEGVQLRGSGEVDVDCSSAARGFNSRAPYVFG
jgi:hypothetical protein